MKNKYPASFLTILLTIIVVATMVSASSNPAAQKVGHHHPLYTEILRNYLEDEDSINFQEGLLVSKDMFSENLVVHSRMGIGVELSDLSNPNTIFNVRLKDEEDRVIVDRESGDGDLLFFAVSNVNMDISFSGNNYLFQTNSRHINFLPSGGVGIKLDSEAPTSIFDVGGSAIIRGSLDMNDEFIRHVANPTNDQDAVTYNFAYNSFLNMNSSRWIESATENYIFYPSGYVIIQDNPLAVGFSPAQNEGLLVEGSVKIAPSDAYWIGDNRGQSEVIEFQNAENVKCWLTVKGGLITDYECEDKLFGGFSSREDCIDAGGEIHTITSGLLVGETVCKFDVSSKNFIESVYHCNNIGWRDTEYMRLQTVTCTGGITPTYFCEGTEVTISGTSFIRQQPSTHIYFDGLDLFDEDYLFYDCDYDIHNPRICYPNVVSIGCY